MKKILIKDIAKKSIAEKLKIQRGNYLITVNNKSIHDILDYKFEMSDEFITIKIENINGDVIEYEIEKDVDEDIGLIFEEQLIDKPKQCQNKCVFCFMDQLPQNVRTTLKFRDDDYRLSFLSGNYVTLTNLKNQDIDRIIKYRLCPINISVHSTDGEVRKKMLNNKNADNLIKYIDRLVENDIQINTQIVLCKGINDGEILEKSIDDLQKYYPKMSSISIVPVGLTKYRDNLAELKPYDKVSATKLIEQVENIQKKLLKKYGSRIVYLADEFYMLSNKEIPKYEVYEEFPQLENGVGMISLFDKQFYNSINKQKAKKINKTVSIATGVSASKYIKKWSEVLEQKYNGIKINVYVIKNNFFGENITVTGLIVGKDILEQLKGKELGEKLFLCDVMLNDDNKVFLDDTPLEKFKMKIKTDIVLISNNGKEFINKIIN